MDRIILDDVLVFFGLMATLGVVATIVIMRLKRNKAPQIDSRALDEIASRLARLEQLAESTSLEVERIGEGQRFTTKLLGERVESQPR